MVSIHLEKPAQLNFPPNILAGMPLLNWPVDVHIFCYVFVLKRVTKSRFIYQASAAPAECKLVVHVSLLSAGSQRVSASMIREIDLAEINIGHFNLAMASQSVLGSGCEVFGFKFHIMLIQ